jgi:TRAP-type C4-dicarboxylate transport system substrate-binding protein
MTIPDLFTTCQRPSKVAWELWKMFPEIDEEFYEVKVIAMYATTPSPPGIGFAMVDKKITTLEQMEGVKMGIYGEMATKTVDALGFTTVAVPPFEVYESMQRGVVDGSFMDVNFLADQNVGEISKYWVSCSLMFCPFWLAMNLDTWNSLPPDIQKLMEDLAPSIPDDCDRFIRDDKQAALDAYPEVEFVEIAPEEKIRWRQRQDPIQEEYLSKLTTDGHKIHTEMLRLMEEYAEALP